MVNTNPTAVGGTPIPITVSAGEQLQADTTRRGQNMTDARARETATIQKEAARKQLTETPDGFVLVDKGTNEVTPLKTPDGQPVRSSIQATKMEGAFNADRAQLTGTASGLDRLRDAALKLKNAKGLPCITGIRGAVPDIYGTDAADAQAQFDTLKSQIGFGVLQDMRQNSKTGGALGNVSDAEGKRLEANLGALSRKQSLEAFNKGLDEVISYTEDAKTRLNDAFNMRHAQFLSRNPDRANDKPQAAPTGGNTVTTPDGKVHTFPNAAAAAAFKKAAGL
jgi:hypothetical protein